MQSIKCVVVGDGAIGKTCLLTSYTTNEFPSQSYPMGLDNYVTVTINEEQHLLGLFDSPGQHDLTGLRLSKYPLTDVFLVCFSIVSPTSFMNVKAMWVPEILGHSMNTPFILVGTMSDLRDDAAVMEKLKKNRQTPIGKEQGEKLARELGAVTYLECSSLSQKGLKNVFNQAVLAALEAKQSPKKEGSCSIM